MKEQWRELKETITEMRDNDGTGTQQEVCKFLANYMEILEKQMQEPKIGHWIAVYQGDEIINYRCSECELGDTNGSTNLYGWDYCRRCGAKLVEPQERSDKE